MARCAHSVASRPTRCSRPSTISRKISSRRRGPAPAPNQDTAMQSIVENDLGTPQRYGGKTVTLTIDDREVSVPEGTSVMRAAALAQVKVPKLCATDQLEAFGSCRLCLVQIEGMRGLPASCTTPVAQGMKVTTQNKQLADIRRGVMELYISDHPLDRLTCSANGHCE